MNSTYPTTDRATLPWVQEFETVPDVRATWRRLCQLPGCLLLESSMQVDSLGRYSFLVADPFTTITADTGDSDPLQEARRLLRKFQHDKVPGLPPFQGGLAGVFSYDLNRSLESVPASDFDDFKLPALVLGGYDVVLAWDHVENRAWIISQGFPETDIDQRTMRAKERANQFVHLIQQREPVHSANEPTSPIRLAVPTYPINVDGLELRSNFSRTDYLKAVQRCIDYIIAGDAFQINLAQQLLLPASAPAEELYEQIRSCNPSTFGGYFDAGSLINRELKILSASPERFFRVSDRRVETRPIKGTRARTGQPRVDIYHRNLLVSSEKDKAENTMIVDLMRNDLSRVCQDDSIVVSQLCEIESYQNVIHLVSAVEGRLNEPCDLVDLLEAVFPGGSITGAPKIRAMEIISELEPSSRGFYCGSMGYLGFNQEADLSILIRTVTQTSGWWQVPVGGGVVVKSEPQNEYDETWTKATALLNAIRRCHQRTGQTQTSPLGS